MAAGAIPPAIDKTLAFTPSTAQFIQGRVIPGSLPSSFIFVPPVYLLPLAASIDNPSHSTEQ